MESRARKELERLRETIQRAGPLLDSSERLQRLTLPDRLKRLESLLPLIRDFAQNYQALSAAGRALPEPPPEILPARQP